MTNKLGRKMTSLNGLLPMSHEPLITLSCEIRGSLTGGSACKCLSRHQLLIVFLFFLLVIFSGWTAKSFLVNVLP